MLSRIYLFFLEVLNFMGSGLAAYSLGIYYLLGMHVEKQDLGKGILFLKKACSNGNNAACDLLGDLYYYGENLVSVDIQLAIKYYSLAKGENDGRVQNKLGSLFSNSLYISPEYEKAYNYFKQSYENGYELAACNLGWFYFAGLYVERNYSLAKHYFDEAIETNASLHRAYYHLGLIYRDGLGVEQNDLEAQRYFLLAEKWKNSEELREENSFWKSVYSANNKTK